MIALLSISFQLYYLGSEHLTASLSFSLLLLTIVLHGLYLLGEHAQSPLPIGLRSWYKEIEQHYGLNNAPNAHHSPKSKTSSKLTYMDLGELLNKVFKGTKKPN